ncbi:MAG: hypothetical protein M1839_003066 [Geoglossum umbratile]|nr:MAG: hypothetical protein M1839_003066 [Geoglossum umbratile]
MSDSAYSVDDDLSRSGFAVVGKIDPALIENVKRRLESAAVKQRYPRQTELSWNSDCDFVVANFETRLKPTITTLRDKPRSACRLVYFHEILQSSEIYRPPFGIGKHIVIIIIRPGSGFPLLCKGSHGSGQGNTDSTSTGLTGEIWQEEGSVVVFDADIARQDPAVEGTGGSGIILWY